MILLVKVLWKYKGRRSGEGYIIITCHNHQQKSVHMSGMQEYIRRYDFHHLPKSK